MDVATTERVRCNYVLKDVGSEDPRITSVLTNCGNRSSAAVVHQKGDLAEADHFRLR